MARICSMDQINEADKRKISAALQQSAKGLAPCTGCGKLTLNRALFFPDRAVDFGGRPDKTRVIIHPMCFEHHNDKDILEKADKVLFLHFAETKGDA